MKPFTFLFILAISLSLINAQNSVIPEKLYVHTDREAYVAGEDVYFKIYQLKSDSQASKYAYLLFRNNKNVVISKLRLEMNKGISYSKFTLPDTLSTGIYQIIGYTNCLRNDPQNTFFKKDLVIANRFDKELNKLDAFTEANTTSKDSAFYSNNTPNITEKEEIITIRTDKDVYKQREKVTLDLKLLDPTHNANLSISVRNIAPGIQTISFKDYSSQIAKNTFREKDCKFPIEIQGVIIDGILKNKDTQEPLINKFVLLSTPDSIPNLQYAKTKKDGTFRFLLSDFYYGKKIYLKLQENLNAQIILLNKYQTDIPFEVQTVNFLTDLKAYLNKSQNFLTIQNDYFEGNSNTENIAMTRSSKIFPYVYAKPYSTVFPSDFFELPDFVEISREIIPELKIRKNKDIYEANMLNSPANSFMLNPPLIFLNGVPIDSISQIITLGSKQIRKINTYSTQRFFGELIFDGILSLYTGSNELDKIKWKKPTVTYLELNNHPLAKLNNDLYTPKSKHYPDYRQLLYWEPDINFNSDKQFSFYASDNTGTYEINIQGLTSEGVPISISKTIQIVAE